MVEPSLESLAQCVAWIESGARARSELRIGTEHECLAIDSAGRPLNYEGEVGVRTLLERLAQRHGWRPVHESGKPIALLRDDASITLEPAGQFELSGAPLKSVTAMLAELERHTSELADVADELGVKFCYVGMNPLLRAEQAPRMPKARYDIMRARMPRVGSMGLDMMHLTCTVQVNIDFADGAEAMEMMRLGHLATPAIIALFANSPWLHGKSAAMASHRAHIWTDVEHARCQPGAMAFDPDATVADWVQWAADVPMYFRKSKGEDGEDRYDEVPWGTTFRQYLERGIDNKRPTLADWELHLSTVFPDMRLKRYIEFRAADCVPVALLPALPALTKGLFYDRTSRKAALALLEDGRVDRAALRAAACQWGLDARLGDHHVGEQARALIALAGAGLGRLATEFGADPAADTALDQLAAIAHGHAEANWRRCDRLLTVRPSLLALV